jgi:hypothetical protein
MDIRKLPIRFILSIAAGIATTLVLSVATREILYLLDIFPKIGEPEFETDLLLIALAYHSFYAVIGAIVTAHFARERARRAAFILGTKEVIMWILGMVLLWKHAAPWYNLSKAALGIPLAMLGWKLYDLYKKSHDKHKVQEIEEQRKVVSRHYFQRMNSGNSNTIKPKQF